jgi:hypothetical protein
MSENVASPTDDMVDGMAKATIYETDYDLPDYVSSKGSSVSQTQMTTVEVDAAMITNALEIITNLQHQVLISDYFQFTHTKSIFLGCNLAAAG